MCDDPAAVSAWLRSQGERVGTNCTVTLDLRAAAPPFAETFDGDGESFAPHHYEQLTTVSGALVLGDVSIDVNGFGLRDHSWGPRSWQAPYFYRWVHGSTDGLGFMGAYFGDAEAATVWTAEDGTTLHGMSEYLDQVHDGRPVGLRV
jgi:hypothetical protein